MDGIHDLGGLEGFGPVEVDPAEPVFHFPWERRALAVTMGTFVAGLSNGGQFRHSIERMDPVHYLSSRYYEHWTTAVATRAVEEGIVALADLEAAAGGRFPLARPVHPDAGGEAGSGGARPARFAVGDRVRVRVWSPRGHTRCPRYVRGRAGEVVRVDPSASFPDLEAHSTERRQEAIYSVRFAARELWGEGAPAADVVHVDLWDSYLERDA
jgi:nitrile hydratase